MSAAGMGGEMRSGLPSEPDRRDDQGEHLSGQKAAEAEIVATRRIAQALQSAERERVGSPRGDRGCRAEFAGKQGTAVSA